MNNNFLAIAAVVFGLTSSLGANLAFGQGGESLPGLAPQGSPTEMLITESLQRDVSSILFSLRGPSALSLGYPMNSDPFWFVRLDPIAKEIELSEQQLVSLAKLEESYGGRLEATNAQLNQLFASERSGSTAGKVEQLQKNIRSLIDSRKNDIEKVLSDSQRTRLSELVLQIEFLVGRDANTLTNDPLAKELVISSEQQSKLMKRAEEIDREVQKEFRALVEKAREKLHAELTAAQRQALQKKLGKPFDFESLDWQQESQSNPNK